MIGGQISGAGLVVWNSPWSRSGSSLAPDWSLYPVATPSSLVVDRGRLYVAAINVPAGGDLIRIWDNFGSVTARKQPDHTMLLSTGSG